MLTPELKRQIKDYCLEKPDKERCGLIIQTNKGLVPYFCRNTTINDETNTFQIDPFDYLRASEKGQFVAAYFHSHPNGNPVFSEFDIANAKGHNLTAILYSIPKDEFIEYDPNTVKSFYIGREFKIGSNDCYKLTQDYYYHELGVKLTNYYRDENWYKRQPKKILERYIFEGFRKVKEGPPKDYDLKTHDVLLVSYFKKDRPHHIMIYIGNDYVLDHPRNKHSTIYNITEPVRKRISHVLRHESQFFK